MRKKAVSKKVPKKTTMLDRLPKNHGERLELMINMTEKRIVLGSQDTTMANQAVRLRAELAAWKASNSK